MANEQILERSPAARGVSWELVYGFRHHGVFVLACLLGWVVWNLPPVAPMGEAGMHFLATMVVAIALWVSEVIGEYIVGLLLLLAGWCWASFRPK
jgi:hypothetical protein